MQRWIRRIARRFRLAWVIGRRRFTERQNPPTLKGDCAMEADVPGELF
jgi:hypothetical protein